jgi:O-acetylhomoserine (thiol)-lyase
LKEELAMKLETVAIHSGYQSEATTRSLAAPIYQTAAYEFESADHAAALFDLEAEGFRYSRINNPTTSILEERVTEMEGGSGALAVSSGQAALHFALANVCHGAGEIVAVPQLYGTTHGLLSHILPQQGVTTRFAASDAPGDIEAQINSNTRAVFCESIGNPAGNLCDIEALAGVAHAHGVPLIVDNTVATPVLWRPIEHGADIVLHSLTKYMGGHGTTLGGLIVDAGTFDWAARPERYPAFCTPDASYHGLVYTDHFGRNAFIARARSVYLRTMGSVLSPFNAFLLLQGIETVSLRVERHVENARKVAEFLRDDRRVAWVSYAGFEDSPYYGLSQRYLGGQAPALLTFGAHGGLEAGKAFYDALKLVRRVVNIGDTKSLACHPASTTHRQMPPEALAKAGVKPEMIRLSIGIEHIDDILADLDQALAAACRPRSLSKASA